MFPSKLFLGVFLIAFTFYPQGVHRVLLTVSHARDNFLNLRSVIYRLADVICPYPEECKNAADEFFATVAGILQDLLKRIAEFVSNLLFQTRREPQDDATVQKRHREAKINAVNYTTDEVNGNFTEAEETVLKSVDFSRYFEKNTCGLNEGMSGTQYDAYVDAIAACTKMPKEQKELYRRMKNFTGGNVLATRGLQFTPEGAEILFTRAAVIPREGKLDMAHSLHHADFGLKPNQSQPEGISVDQREHYLTFFRKRAIEGFRQQCDFVLKTLEKGD